VKIGPVDNEIIVIRAIIKKDKKRKRKKLTQAKYIAGSASVLSGLNKCCKNLQKFAKVFWH